MKCAQKSNELGISAVRYFFFSILSSPFNPVRGENYISGEIICKLIISGIRVDCNNYLRYA